MVVLVVLMLLACGARMLRYRLRCLLLHQLLLLQLVRSKDLFPFQRMMVMMFAWLGLL